MAMNQLCSVGTCENRIGENDVSHVVTVQGTDFEICDNHDTMTNASDKLAQAARQIKGVTDEYDIPDEMGVELGKAYSKVWKAKQDLERKDD